MPSTAAERRARAKAEAIKAVQQGGSHTDAARRAGVTRSTVQRWCKEAGISPGGVRAEPPAEPDEGAEPEGEDQSTLDFVRGLMRRARHTAEESRAVGNYGAAQRSVRDAAQLATVVARLEKQAQAAGEGQRYSTQEINAAIEGLRERVFEALKNRPLTCAECGRKLAARMAGVEDE